MPGPPGTLQREDLSIEAGDIWAISRPGSACWVSTPSCRRPGSGATWHSSSSLAAAQEQEPCQIMGQAMRTDVKVVEPSDGDLHSRLMNRVPSLAEGTRTACLQRLEQRLEAMAVRAKAENTVTHEDGASQEALDEMAPEDPDTQDGSSGLPSARDDTSSPCGHHSVSLQPLAAAMVKTAKLSPPVIHAAGTLVSGAPEPVVQAVCPSSNGGSDSLRTAAMLKVLVAGAAGVVEHTSKQLLHQSAAATEAGVKTTPGKATARRRVGFKDGEDGVEIVRRRANASAALRNVTKPIAGSVGSSWKRLPKHCRSMREELCRSILVTFLDSIREEFLIARDVNPLSESEERQIAVFIKNCDVVALVKHLAETELHIRFGTQRSRITPEAPLNMKISADLKRERMEMAAHWGVREQALREERVFGLFLQGPFTWQSLRQLLWDACQTRPAVEDNPGVTEEEEQQHNAEAREITWYKEQLQHRAMEAFSKRLEAEPERSPDHAQVAPEGLIDALTGQGDLGLSIPKALLRKRKKSL